MRKADFAKCLGAGLVLGLCFVQPAQSQAPESEPDRVQVFYPKGECETGVIEIEVYDRSTQKWQPHAEHPQIEADSCQVEDPGVLLQELRVRCADPKHPARSSEWLTGVEVFEPLANTRCQSQ